MNKITRSIAVFFSTIILFVMALAGIISGRPPLACVYKALTGALLFYLAVSIAVKIFFGLVITAIAKSQTENKK